ncbi:MAG: galactitol 2-dehydrogenase [Alphaproteobacteria bacterium]|nr:galactitol 2-dehydrogenase [Alphaproteobacteria bacterium]
MRLADRAVLITGAASGIGWGMAKAMAREGARVAIADIDRAKVEQRVAELGGAAYGVTADVGDLAEIDRMVSSVTAHFGRLDVMVNNAGVTRRCAFMDIDEALWDQVHRVNAKGVFFCLQRAAREMISQGGGVIINTASIAGRGYPGTSNAAYAASKGAVITMTMLAARALGRHNITVNSICPGVTRTELAQNIMQLQSEKEGRPLADIEAQAARGIPIGRMNEPDDIAEMAVFLASPAARNITGQSINVDGGLIMM